MNKRIVFILAVMVTFVNSNYDCIEHLKQYFEELYTSATEGYQEKMLLSPSLWCRTFYKDVQTCSKDLIEDGYKNVVLGLITNMSSFQALKHSYRNACQNSIDLKEDRTKAYYKYLFKEYYKILETKRLRNPVEFCKNVSAIHLPSDYAGLFEDNNMSNDEINFQRQEQNRNAGERSSRLENEVLDNEGHVIDLNFPPINN